jgi:hypothetical protein
MRLLGEMARNSGLMLARADVDGANMIGQTARFKA